MAKFNKAFRGVPAGEVYPVDYQAGDDCPEELLDAATAEDVIASDEEAAKMAKEAEAKAKTEAKAQAEADKAAE